MEKNSEKTDRIINTLRASKPILDSASDIEREVIKKISQKNRSETVLSDITDFLFGWVYIGWVRRSLITASVFLVAFFVWQQGTIIKQINYLSSQPVMIESESRSFQTGFSGNKVMLLKLFGNRLPSQNVTISKEQMDTLLESVNDLQTRYRDLINLIEEDPELKTYLENKMKEMNRTKIKL
ncbi:MAG: hypothetical protein IPH69_00840 [Bacteroidales bacterium]|nr:hypothetical protein [Bacteroidales bacterium]